MQGLGFVRRGDCARAIPVLEGAERARHRPTSAVSLADCYVARGALIRASEVFHQVSVEKPAAFWTRADRFAQKSAAKKAAEVDARIPTVRIELAGVYDDVTIEINGHVVAEPRIAQQVPIGVAVPIVVRAAGHVPAVESLIFVERERRVVSLHLEPSSSKTPPGQREPADPSARSSPPAPPSQASSPASPSHAASPAPSSGSSPPASPSRSVPSACAIVAPSFRNS